MRRNFKLTIEYDGTGFHGWQRQKEDRSVQGEIETALKKMTGQNIVLTGSGRTDAGVHALAQVANFHCDSDLYPEVFQKGLNSLISPEIVIKSCEEVPEEFHARYDAKSKTYHYKILNCRIPSAICRQYAWFIREKLDYNAMRTAIHRIIGTHDFKAFEGVGSPRSTSIRNVMSAGLFEHEGDYLIFEIMADGFLRFMVRNLVGTLVDVGRHKITAEDFQQILLSRQRGRAGVTAPPRGLFLINVQYE